MQVRFAVIGTAGFVAPRHLEAIKSIGGKIVASLDPSDSVGILDKYGFDIDHFTEFERFDRHLDKLSRRGEGVDYISICSPNYLHDAHIRFALRIGADAICEKPLVINPWNLDGLQKLEEETGRRVWNILQLRHHPEILQLKHSVSNILHFGKALSASLDYYSPRGKWYNYSWKGSKEKSGGIVTNIGIHLFDMLIFIFGKVVNTGTFYSMEKGCQGTLSLETACVDWRLSIDTANKARRTICINGKRLEFSDSFANLHTEVYRDILNGNGFGINDARPAIELVHTLRNKE